MSNPPRFHIQLLGNFRLLAGDTPVTSINTPRMQALLAYLVLQRDAPHLRQHLAFQLWPDSAESQARTNLRKLFFQLQRALPDADRLLVADTLTLGWNAQAHFTLDVAELQQVLAHLKTEPRDLDALRRVVELYQGPLLLSCYDDWIAPLRQQLHQAVMDALERLITLLENQRAYETGIHYAQRLLAFDPLEEKTYQRLMRLHALEGDYTGALRVYQDCVAVLQRELDVPPDAETQALYERLRQRDAALAAKTEQKRPQVKRLPLIGRQREWQMLQETWRQAMRGQTHFVCIWGEAGIGKTRLAEELLDWANQQGILSVRTRAYAAQGALAYAPVTTLLRSPTLSSRLTRLGANWLSEVARLLPELLEQHPALPPPQPMTESWQRQRFFEALTRAVLADDQPLLLLFDDLHWCDQETLTWLHYLLHFAPQARLLVVGTSRVEEVGSNHPLATQRQGLQREGLLTEIDLTALSAAEVTSLAHTLADHQLTSEQTQQLYADTEGNPLFVVETVRAALSGGVREEGSGGENSPAPLLPYPSPSLPPKIQAVIQARLSQLSPSTQKIASLAAVIGRSFTFAVLMTAAHVDEDTLLDSLDELGERRILREQGTDGYDFSHDRIRDVAYAELSQARRRQLHRHVAEALEAVYLSSLDEVSGRLAEHYTQMGNHAKAIHYLQRAGERALTQFAHQTAIEYFSHALELIPATNHTERFPLLLARLRIFNHEGLRADGKRDLEALQAMVGSLDDGTEAAIRRRAEVALSTADFGRGIGDKLLVRTAAQEAAHLAEQCKAEDLAAQAYFLWGDAELGENNSPALLEKALTLAHSAGLLQLEAETLSVLGLRAIYSGAPLDKIEAELQQSLTIYQKLGDPAGQAGALGMLAYIIYTQREGNYDLGIRYCEQALQLVTDGWDAKRFALGNLGCLWYFKGDYARAKAYLEGELAIVQQVQHWGGESGSRMELGCLYMAMGDTVTAQVHFARSLHLCRENDAKQQYRVKLEGHLARFYLLTGDKTRAAAHGEAAVSFARKLNDPRIQGDAFTRGGRVLVSQGKLDEAAELFQQALTCFRQMEQHNHAMMPLAGLAEIALRQGNPAQAQSWVESILTHLQTHQLDCTDEDLYVYMTGYRVLHKLQDPRAATLLHLAQEQLQTRAASIAGDAERQRFWSAPPHAEVLAATHTR